MGECNARARSIATGAKARIKFFPLDAALEGPLFHVVNEAAAGDEEEVASVGALLLCGSLAASKARIILLRAHAALKRRSSTVVPASTVVRTFTVVRTSTVVCASASTCTSTSTVVGHIHRNIYSNSRTCVCDRSRDRDITHVHGRTCVHIISYRDSFLGGLCGQFSQAGDGQVGLSLGGFDGADAGSG